MVPAVAVAGDGVKVPGQDPEIHPEADVGGVELIGRGVAAEGKANIARRGYCLEHR